MLSAKYHFAEGTVRPTIIVGEGYDVALVAQAWNEAQLPTAATTVRLLYVSGFVDSELRKFLHSSFTGVEVVEKYSLTEIFGGATRGQRSTGFALDPYVIGEVVDELGTPVPLGRVGELVLTELFPFVQMQPLIRYRTGDVVLLEEDSHDNVRFQWWGRRKNCILTQVNGVASWVLGYGPVADWLSLQPLVARHVFKPHLSSVKSVDFGPPCVTLGMEGDGDIISIDVGLRINPWWAKEAVQDFTQAFWAILKPLIVAPAENVKIRLGFRHVPNPVDDFKLMVDKHFLRLPPRILSDRAPLLP